MLIRLFYHQVKSCSLWYFNAVFHDIFHDIFPWCVSDCEYFLLILTRWLIFRKVNYFAVNYWQKQKLLLGNFTDQGMVEWRQADQQTNGQVLINIYFPTFWMACIFHEEYHSAMADHWTHHINFHLYPEIGPSVHTKFSLDLIWERDDCFVSVEFIN